MIAVLLALMLGQDASCLECHADLAAEVRGSVHEKAAVGCVSCHGTDDIVAKKHARRPTFKPMRLREVADGCGGCHESTLKAFKPTEHFETALLGPGDPPHQTSCTACHTHHAMPHPERNKILARCADCHGTTGPEYQEAVKAFAGMASLESKVHRLGPHHPIRDEWLALRIEQHGLEFGTIQARAQDAMTRLDKWEREHGLRHAYLVPVMVLIVVAGSLGLLLRRK